MSKKTDGFKHLEFCFAFAWSIMLQIDELKGEIIQDGLVIRTLQQGDQKGMRFSCPWLHGKSFLSLVA